ncbi:MAG: hypothetical protein AAGF26_19935 [Cyanobacteria bacterium P01_G01_bin.49]
MNQTPITVTYTLEEVLGQINQKLDKLDDKFDKLQQEVISLKGDVKALNAKVEGIGKRLDSQEFINRSVIVGFILAIAAGAIKLFFPRFTPIIKSSLHNR